MIKLEQKAITSVEVAEMMEINHFEILRKLEGNSKVVGIIPTMTDNKIVVSDYFIKSTYQDTSGKENKCYLITKLGCDFLANKFTGEKGVLFTARYVKKFRDMEEELKTPKTPIQLLEMELAIVKEVYERVDSVDRDLQQFKMDMPILGIEESRITNSVRKKGVNCLGGKDSTAYQNKSLRGKVYSDIYGQLKREFGVSSYKAIKRSQVEMAIDVINKYKLPYDLRQQVDGENNQISFRKEEIA